MNTLNAARMIDISAVRTQHTWNDIQYLAEVAKQYRFINVHTLPCWTESVSRLLRNEHDIYIGAPVGFPSGAHKTSVKLLEAQNLVADGVQEMDIVMNVGKLKNKEYDYVHDELCKIIRSTPDHILKKVIIESACLTDEELYPACQIVIDSGADFIKTGTGWVSGKMELDRIKNILTFTKEKIRLKVAGGIRTREEFEELCHLGVDRFGINVQSALNIVRSYQ